jgi:hypothetical protein
MCLIFLRKYAGNPTFLVKSKKIVLLAKITRIRAGGGGGAAWSLRVSRGGPGGDPCGAARPVLRGGGDRAGGVRRQVRHRHRLDPSVQRVPGMGKKQGLGQCVSGSGGSYRIRMFFGPLGSGSVSHKYGSGCGSGSGS